MDVYDAIRTRRSVRAYRPNPIPADVLHRVLDAARVAPSASNCQPTRLLLITNPEVRQKLAEMCANQWDHAFIAQPPVVVVACGLRMNLTSGGTFEPRPLIDGSIALDHLTLAARAEGLGTCWIGCVGRVDIKHYLGLPEDTDIVGATPLGYPEGEAFKDPGDRLPFEEYVHWETWE